jgi:hypothetical protein
VSAKATARPTGASRNSPGDAKKPRAKKPIRAVTECQHAWSDPPVIRLAHYPLMAKEGVEAIGILACWRCGAVKAAIEYSEEGKQRWHSL